MKQNAKETEDFEDLINIWYNLVQKQINESIPILIFRLLSFLLYISIMFYIGLAYILSFSFIKGLSFVLILYPISFLIGYIITKSVREVENSAELLKEEEYFKKSFLNTLLRKGKFTAHKALERVDDFERWKLFIQQINV